MLCFYPRCDPLQVLVLEWNALAAMLGRAFCWLVLCCPVEERLVFMACGAIPYILEPLSVAFRGSGTVECGLRLPRVAREAIAHRPQHGSRGIGIGAHLDELEAEGVLVVLAILPGS